MSVQTDVNNCGQCGNSCSASQTCYQGHCVAKPPDCGTQGVQYAINYNYKPDDDSSYSKFEPSFYQTDGPLIVGTTKQIGGWTGQYVYTSGWTVYNSYYMINHRAYIMAPLDGTYVASIDSSTQNGAYFWVGDNAYVGYTKANSIARWANGPSGSSGSPTVTFNMQAGQFYPIRLIWASSYDNQRTLGFSIAHQDTGLVIVNSAANSAVPFLVYSSCSGSGTPPDFQNWAHENVIGG